MLKYLKICRKTKGVVKEFDQQSNRENIPESTGFFDKVKDFWDELNKK